MRILQAHKFFYRRGGAETVFLDTIAGLRARGHEVIEFSTQNKNNLPSEYSSYFVSELPELGASRHGWADRARIFRRMFKSKEVENKLRALTLATEPEVAHLHNVYHHLSAGIFSTLKKFGLPVVLTVHDVFPMCPNHRMLRNTDVLCEECYRHKFYNCTRHRCINDAFVPSAAGSFEAYYYWLNRIWSKVDRFVCPSEFFLNKMVAWGFPKEKMRLVRNPFSAPVAAPPLGNKIVYLGRMHVEKGIRVLLDALPKLRAFQVVLAGSGPDDDLVDKYIRQYSLTNVERVGWVGGERWKQIVADARVMVVPSLFYENCSLTVLEAMANGRLTVATDRGGNRELVTPGLTGFLARPSDPDALAAEIIRAMSLSESEAAQVVQSARAWVKTNHDPDGYFSELEAIYREVVKK